MKRFLKLFLLLTTLKTYSQDTVLLNNNDKIAVILTEINPDNIRFKRFDNQSGPVYTVLKAEVISVTYFANGKTEFFQKQSQNKTTSTTVTDTTASVAAKINAADTVVFRSGKRVPVRIIEITATAVKYKQLDNPDGPQYAYSKNEIQEVILSTGLRQKFDSVADQTYNSGSSPGTYGSMSQKARSDAHKYYKHNGGSIGVGIATVFAPIIGIIPAAICSFVPPKEKNLHYPDERLWRNSVYKTTYTNEALKIKRKRIWITFGVITAGWVAVAFITN